MKLINNERKQDIIHMLDIYGNHSDGYKYAHAELAKMLVGKSCFDMNIDFGPDIIKIHFTDDDNNELCIEINGGGYYIYGEKKTSIDDLNNAYSTYTINKYFKPHELFHVVNEIKMFLMGRPKNSVLFTGAFCPPHAGHRSVIENALNSGYDYAIIAVSNQEFLERKLKRANDMTEVIFSEQERIDMIFAMTYDIPNVLVYGAERGYTYEVLCDVKKKYCIEELSFACGSDKIREVNRWGFHDKLLVEFGFYIMQREGTIESIEKQCGIFTKYFVAPASMEFTNLSSTLVRTKIAEKLPVNGLVTPSVEDFLRRRKFIR